MVKNSSVVADPCVRPFRALKIIPFIFLFIPIVTCGKNQELPTSAQSDPKAAALVNVELGLGYLAQGQMARAKSKLNHAIALSPHSAEPHSAMAYFLERSGELNDAEKAHEVAILCSRKKRKVSTGAVYNNYGAFLCRQGRYKEADVAFQQSLKDKQYERTAEVYENAGLCALQWSNALEQKNLIQSSNQLSTQSQLQTQKLAMRYFKAALRHDPNRSNAAMELKKLQHRKLQLSTLNLESWKRDFRKEQG